MKLLLPLLLVAFVVAAGCDRNPPDPPSPSPADVQAGLPAPAPSDSALEDPDGTASPSDATTGPERPVAPASGTTSGAASNAAGGPERAPAGAAAGAAAGAEAGAAGGGTLQDRFEGTTEATRARRAGTGQQLVEVRAGRHGSYDRLVFEFAQDVPGYEVAYADRPLRRCRTGGEIDLPGARPLTVRFDTGGPQRFEAYLAVQGRGRITGLPVLREHALACDAVGEMMWALGVAEEHPYRTLVLEDPPRLVVDVRH